MNKISISMCTYNGEKYIKEQLNSIINQTHKPDEIIIVDDCSKDNTVSIAMNILDNSSIPHHIIINESNLGVLKSFEKSISLCTGDIIFTADQDDVWVNNKIELFMKTFEDDSCIMAFSDGKLVDGELNVINESVWDSLNLKRAGLSGSISQEKIMKLLMYYWIVPGTMMAFRKSLSDKAFPIPTKGNYIHDSWLAINAPIYGNIAVIDEPLTLYRQHGGNTVGAPTSLKTKKEQNITQIRKVLFYLNKHYDRLSVLIDIKEDSIPQNYKIIIDEYMTIFKKWSYYENSSKIRKMLFIMARIIDNKMKMFDISRSDLINYLFQ